MNATTFLIICYLLLMSNVAYAESDAEKKQDAAYIQCLVKRNVTPPNIPKKDNEFCLREAGVIDMGDAARSITARTWHNCLLKQSNNLDDGVSSPRDISRLIIKLCEKEWREFAETLWMYPNAKESFINGVEKYAVNEGIHAILINRKGASNRP